MKKKLYLLAFVISVFAVSVAKADDGQVPQGGYTCDPSNECVIKGEGFGERFNTNSEDSSLIDYLKSIFKLPQPE